MPLYLISINCRCIDPNNINQRILNPAAWQDVVAGTIGMGSAYCRTFQIWEKVNLNIRAEFFNTCNRVSLGTPSSSNPTQTTTVNNPTGAISGFGYYNVGNASNACGQCWTPCIPLCKSR
jgi:hypothetical protein